MLRCTASTHVVSRLWCVQIGMFVSAEFIFTLIMMGEHQEVSHAYLVLTIMFSIVSLLWLYSKGTASTASKAHYLGNYIHIGFPLSKTLLAVLYYGFLVVYFFGN